MSLYIAAYDISDDDRRERVAIVLLSQGRRVQESVYELELEPDELRDLRARLATVLGPDDHFDVYPIDERGSRRHDRWQRPPDSSGPVIYV